MKTTRVKTGDTIRLYGLKGRFVVSETYSPHFDFTAHMEGNERVAFPAKEASVVEINGQPVPLQSCPIGYVASDYPHRPQFDYNDGPQANAVAAMNQWTEAAMR